VLDSPACNTHDFLLRDTCVSSTQLNRPISNELLSTLKNLSCRKYSFTRLTQFSQGNNVLDDTCCNIDFFLSRDSCVSSTQMNRPIKMKCVFLPLQNHDG
jgi:hypothetical protein